MKIIGTKEYKEIKNQLQETTMAVNCLRSELWHLKQDVNTLQHNLQQGSQSAQAQREINCLRSKLEDFEYSMRRIQDDAIAKAVFIQDLNTSVEEKYYDWS